MTYLIKLGWYRMIHTTPTNASYLRFSCILPLRKYSQKSYISTIMTVTS